MKLPQFWFVPDANAPHLCRLLDSLRLLLDLVVHGFGFERLSCSAKRIETLLLLSCAAAATTPCEAIASIPARAENERPSLARPSRRGVKAWRSVQS